MSVFATRQFLPRVMWADAASCAATGALQLMATQLLARLSGLPVPLLVATGAFLVVYGAAAAWLASRAALPRRLIALVAVGNFGWAVGCVALLASSGTTLSPLGWIWVLAQALTVLVLGELQWMGLRATRVPRPGMLAV